MRNMRRGGNFDFWRSTSVSTVNDYSTVQRNRLRLEFMHVSLHRGTLKLSMATTTTHRASGLLVDALDKLLADNRFGPPSAAAVTARKTGECLHQWLAAAEHQEKAKVFADILLAFLDTCFDPRLTARVQKETMLGKFHQLRCFQPFVCMWRTFLMETLSVDACPIFFSTLPMLSSEA